MAVAYACVMSRASIVLALCLAVVGCSVASEEEEVNEGEAAFGDRVGHDQLPTTEPGITLFDGYNTLFDLRRPRCVEPLEQRPALVGQAFQQTTIKSVRSDVELARELGVDTSFALKAPMASAQGAASLLRSFKGATSNVNYLVQAVQSYTVQTNAPFVLTTEASTLLRERPNDFLVRCGDRFVTGVVYQAKIEALITFETQSEESALSLQGSISGGGPASVVQLDGSMKAKLADASKRSGVSTTVSVTAQGFDITGNEALVGIGGTVEDKLTRIDVVAGQMGASLRADRDRDVQGYANNSLRSAIPAGVQLMRYGDAANAPTGVDTSAPFRRNHELLRATEKFLRTFGQLRMQMEHAYRYEIRPFQEAGLEAQASFNLMPPAAPKRFSSELRPIASLWAERFRTDDGLDVGTETAKVQEVISRCVDNAKLGDFSDCHPGVDPLRLPAHAAGMKAVSEYLSTGRIVKMRAFVVRDGAETTHDSGRDACRDMNGWENRLPTADEAAWIAPLVAAAGGTTSSIWTAGTSTCSDTNGGMPFFENRLEGGETKLGCDTWSFFARGARSTICVPQSGPVGKRDDL